jgi:hypothetical protein
VHSRCPPGGKYRTTDLRPAPPITDSLAASFTASARHQHDGRRSLPPTEQVRLPRSEQETWRERPRCARCKWPRACPEGSLTPWLSVSCVGRLSVCGRSRRRRESSWYLRAERREDLLDNPGALVREILITKSHWFRARSRDRSGVRGHTIGARFWPHIRATSCTSSDAPTITPSMLDLCSASCKARRFAPPAHTRGLRALTMPARRSVLAIT